MPVPAIVVKPNKASTEFGFEATTSIGLLLAVLLLVLLLVDLTLDEVLASDIPAVVVDFDAVVVRPAVDKAEPHPVAATAGEAFFTLLVAVVVVEVREEEGFFLVGEPRLGYASALLTSNGTCCVAAVAACFC